MKKSFVIVDIETTGLNKERNRITEIAALRFDGENIVDEYHTLVNPQVIISPFIEKFTGISQEMVSGAPCIEDVLPGFLDFLGDDIFVAHHAAFDVGFLSYAIHVHLGHQWKHQVLCTRKLANRLLHFLPSKKLGALCEYFGIVNTQAHRAMADALATTHVFQHFLHMLLQVE